MRIFLTDLQMAADVIEKLTASLPAEHRHRAGDPAATIGFHLVRYALHQISPKADADRWLCNANGKPHLIAGKPFFNLSHSRHGVAVVVSDVCEVGIDLEEVKAHPFKFTRRYFTEQEQIAVESAEDPTGEIIRIWTAKEAAAKCSGTGIDRNFRNIPTNGVKNIHILIGGIPHWLSVAPTDVMPKIEWVNAAQL